MDRREIIQMVFNKKKVHRTQKPIDHRAKDDLQNETTVSFCR